MREDSESLGEPVQAESDKVEHEDRTQETRPESAERYTPSSNEQITPTTREELIVRLLAEAMRRARHDSEVRRPSLYRLGLGHCGWHRYWEQATRRGAKGRHKS